MDLSQDLLNKAKIHEKPITLLPMNAEQLQFPNESFDVVSLSLIFWYSSSANMCCKNFNSEYSK
ncbi:methyltransferase domain-containing protein [Bacillus cereus group sp. N21]|uniref:methyltransferase domain-containing protein n=1 Tax=Bacillus cereus group sp. N21 TaxID=2794591 RepID=UPI0027DDA4EA|nr:methyltransferase domain-containing protein [Bacillus cereus group sp. N21]